MKIITIVAVLGLVASACYVIADCQAPGINVANPNCCTYQAPTVGTGCIEIRCYAGSTDNTGNLACANAATGWLSCSNVPVQFVATQLSYPTITGGMCTGTPTSTSVTNNCQSVGGGGTCPPPA